VASGLFISFEGADGTGKSTQIARLAEHLRAGGKQVVTTREPGGTPIGEYIRQILLDSRTTSLAARAELALMFASRAQQIAEVIRPAVSAGKIVLCDRFTDSSEAYQGFARGLGSDAVLAMHRIVCEDLQPDLTVLLALPNAARSLARAQQRNSRTSSDAGDEARFENEGAAFQARVAAGYAAIARREPERVRMVDASRSIEEVHRAIVELVSPLLAR